MIEIDGSVGEGGGQVLRTAIGLAAALREDVRIVKIRAGRSEPGLKAQHLTGIRAAAKMSQAELDGDAVGSASVVFKSGKLQAGSFRFDVGTAGSISLVLQTLMPLCAFAPGEVDLEITGGTDVKWSPPIDYVRMIVFPVLRLMGYSATVEVGNRGHYPRGGGAVRFKTTSDFLLSSIIGDSPGAIRSVTGISHSAGLPAHVAKRQAESARLVLEQRGLPVEEIMLDSPERNVGVGSGITVGAKTESGAVLGGDCLGERGVPAEEVGSHAARRLVEEVDSQSFLDRHMGDMIVPYMALADGVSEVTVSEITQHCKTNVLTAEMVSGVRFEVVGELGQKGRLRARGIGAETSP